MDYILFVRADVTVQPNAEEVMVRGLRGLRGLRPPVFLHEPCFCCWLVPPPDLQGSTIPSNLAALLSCRTPSM